MGFGHRNCEHLRGQQLTAEKFNTFIGSYRGHALAQLVEALRYKPGRSRVRFPMVSLDFFN